MSSSVKRNSRQSPFRPILSYFKVVVSQILSFPISQTFNGHISMKIHDHETNFFKHYPRDFLLLTKLQWEFFFAVKEKVSNFFASEKMLFSASKNSIPRPRYPFLGRDTF